MNSSKTDIFSQEVESGNRFEFGKNWANFLKSLNETQIIEAENSLKEKLGVTNLDGKTFLDVGCGSGLFSLAACRLGAKVTSFDFDPSSVKCAEALKEKYFANDPSWTIRQGSALDDAFLKTLKQFDVVYSWGVLHHTGDMWAALEKVETKVSKSGTLFISLYNDQGIISAIWTKIKQIYNKLPSPLNSIFAVGIILPREIAKFAIFCALLKPNRYISNILNYRETRGMSWFHDQIDWIGGYPFEVSKPEQIFDFFKEKQFVLENLSTCGGRLGCNEYVFSRAKPAKVS